jgi:hypothetical protein
MTTPEVNKTYKRFDGEIFRVIALATEELCGQREMVVFQNIKTKKNYVTSVYLWEQLLPKRLGGKETFELITLSKEDKDLLRKELE